jgi:uncharacterized membrane protein YgcG
MRRWLLGCLLLIACCGHVSAREVIEAFNSSVVVLKDGTLEVEEVIRVRAEGREIRRGIYRDFPTDYRAQDGTAVRVGFSVVAIERDGNAEPYVIERLGNGIRVRIGSRDIFLDKGTHTYRIRYTTSRQLGFFQAYDELYWNVTGNGWSFPIAAAQVRIKLPEGAVISQHQLYTGFQGVAGKDARVVSQSGNGFEAAVTRELDPGEGFTVAVGWQKGIVNVPTPNQRLWWWLSDNLGYAFLALTVLASLLYYFLAWSRVGRDPRKGTIVPLFHPPEGLGPAGVRYIWKQKFDNEAFAAALVGLAVKGRLKIDNDDGDYSLTRQPDTGPKLTSSESSLYSALLDQPMSLSSVNHTFLNNASERLHSVLAQEYKGSMFERNLGWFALGAILSGAGLLLSGFFMPAGEGTLLTFAGIFSAVWWGVLIAVGYGAVKGLSAARGILDSIGSILRLVFLVPFAVGGVLVPGAVLSETGSNSAVIVFIALAVILGVINLVFYKLMPAATPVGRRILDQIEGFRMYLTTAEEKRLNALNPPEKTPELFERYLPYAMALDCENQWNEKFAAVLAAAAAAGATAPIWYGGSHSGWHTGGFASGLNQSLTSSISSASTPPGSTSGSSGGWSGGGSGGGGFSGGGGGGGGGGGW